MPLRSSSSPSKFRSSMRSAARVISSHKKPHKKTAHSPHSSSPPDIFPDRSPPAFSSSIPFQRNVSKAKSSSSLSFPNLGWFVQRERRCSDLSTSNQATHPQHSVSTSASTPISNVRASVSHHRHSSSTTSKSRRSLFSHSRSVSLDLISRRRKSSNSSLTECPPPSPPHLPSEHCPRYYANTGQTTAKIASISSIHCSQQRHSRDYSDLVLDSESLEPNRVDPNPSCSMYTVFDETSSLYGSSPVPNACHSRKKSISNITRIALKTQDDDTPRNAQLPSQTNMSAGSFHQSSPSDAPLPNPVLSRDPSELSSDSETNRFSTKSAPSAPSSTSNKLLRGLRSSQRTRRLSIGHRTRSRDVRSSSFGEIPRTMWTSGGFLSQRHSTDDGIWSHSRQESDHDSFRSFRRKRHSHSYSDFELAEEDDIVEIGNRLPDRTDRIGEEDVFGRRRGDFVFSNESIPDGDGRPVLASYDDVDDTSIPQHLGSQMDTNGVMGDSVHGLNSQQLLGTDEDRENTVGEAREEEETIRNIAKAMDSSKGRLGKSANMNKAFRAVIRSGDGFVRKSDVIQATLNSNDSKDASMIILLEPDSYDSFSPTPQTEGVQSTSLSEESGSVNVSSRANGVGPTSSFGFSTSMTAKQCAATLETMLREMACKVSRHKYEMEAGRCTIQLCVTRAIGGSGRYEEGGKGKRRGKLQVMVTIREEDRIRTSVSFSKPGKFIISREPHEPLCSEIRDRFQREWPAVVEALYIRLPSTVPVTSNNSP